MMYLLVIIKYYKDHVKKGNIQPFLLDNRGNQNNFKISNY